MESINKFISENLFLFFAFAFVWTVSVFGLMLWRRKQRGLILPKASDSGVVFVERFASGSSHKSWMTRMGGASNCLTIIVTRSQLGVTTFFPFTAFAGTYDLEHVVPVSDITALNPKGKVVEIEFQKIDGTLRKLSLRLRDPEGFLRALEQKPKSAQDTSGNPAK